MEATLNDRRDSGDHIRATVSGDVSGQVAVGKDIKQTRTTVAETARDDQKRKVADLRRILESEAPPEESQAALGRLDELEEAITAVQQDSDTIKDIVVWFSTHVPTMAKAVADATQS